MRIAACDICGRSLSSMFGPEAMVRCQSCAFPWITKSEATNEGYLVTGKANSTQQQDLRGGAKPGEDKESGGVRK